MQYTSFPVSLKFCYYFDRIQTSVGCHKSSSFFLLAIGCLWYNPWYIISYESWIITFNSHCAKFFMDFCNLKTMKKKYLPICGGQLIRRWTNKIDSQFGRLTQIMLGIPAAFVILVSVTICFALWDRCTTIRPFEAKVKEIKEGISENRSKSRNLLEAFKTLSKTDEKVAEILKSLNFCKVSLLPI